MTALRSGFHTLVRLHYLVLNVDECNENHSAQLSQVFTRSLVTRGRRSPRALVARAWAWLCAHTEDLNEKRRCLTAIVELDPKLEWAQLAIQHVRHRQAQMN
jgi:hypothetical protein